MTHNFSNYVNDCFSRLVESYGFSKENELNDGVSYSVEFISKDFAIKIEKYRREFYATLYKKGSDKEVNLFNLLSYLNQGFSDTPKAEYFSSESDIEGGYRKQLNYISTIVYENFTAINDFFISGSYESRFAALEKHIQNKYPELFKKKLKN